VVVAAALAGIATGCGGTAAARGPVAATAAQEAAALHGGVLRPADAEPPLTLTDTSGSSYDIVARNVGKVTLVYFGYTHCPDICPTTMADIAQALRQSPPSVRQQVSVVFVTVDPARDKPAVLRKWLDHFNPRFVGLRGPLPAVVRAQRLSHLPVSKVSRNGKTVEHSAEILAYTPDRLAHVIYFEGPSTIDDLTHDLPILVRGHGFGT
jgi:protein SCO1/2